MKHLLLSLLLVGLAASAQAQTQPAPAPKQPTVLRPGHMQAQRTPATNRPDVPPQFPGGAEALGEFFALNVQYPEAARVKQITGSVLTAFTVEADGRLSNATVVKGLSPECDAEALRVLALLPPWKPATRKGVALPVQVQLPVPFANSQIVEIEKSKTKVKFE
ncbi:energy transducer TonB [Hymenobacter sp. DG25B]|uniref:energy transducer TonB n=1 Tax=Hymenobacter sp. DG25B TaxID=1385664 RepID=UPI000A87694E|nr:energy transducer TonB [Hymenobacter sp. DG25B]